MYFEISMFIFAVGFLSIFCGGIFMVTLFIKQEQRRKEERAMPVVITEATLVEKRKVRSASTKMHGTRTRYYATFEFENGDLQEFIIQWAEYLLYEEGFFGHLSFQGTIFKNFEKIM